MPTTPIDIAKLFVAYFDLSPHPLNLEYSAGQRFADIAAGYGGSPQFAAAHAGESNAAMVRSLYHQLFGHAADTPGAQYWTGLLDRGTISRSELPMYLALGAQGDDQAALDCKASAALAFSREIDTPEEYLAYQEWNAKFVSPYLDRVVDAASLEVFKGELPSLVSAVLRGGRGLLGPGASDRLCAGRNRL